MNRSRTFVYVGSGTWGPDEAGWVTVYELDRATGRLVFVSSHRAGGLASFLAIDEKRHRLFVANEDEGGVLSFSIDPASGKLTALTPARSQNQPVYLCLTRDGQRLLAANYEQGSVDVYPISDDGHAQAPVQNVATGAQAHCVIIEDENRVLVANKGADTISHFVLSEGKLRTAPPSFSSLRSPRHICQGLHNRIYVVSEEADLITAYDIEHTGAFEPTWQGPRLPQNKDAAPVAARDTGAHIQVTPDGQFLYATNRGHSNTIVGYNISTSPPTPLGHKGTNGQTPRHFAIDPRQEFVIVANREGERNLSLMKISTNGSLEDAGTLFLEVSPFCVGLAQF